MQRLEVSGAVRPIYESLGVKRLKILDPGRVFRSRQNSLISRFRLRQVSLQLYFNIKVKALGNVRSFSLVYRDKIYLEAC